MIKAWLEGSLFFFFQSECLKCDGFFLPLFYWFRLEKNKKMSDVIYDLWGGKTSVPFTQSVSRLKAIKVEAMTLYMAAVRCLNFKEKKKKPQPVLDFIWIITAAAQHFCALLLSVFLPSSSQITWTSCHQVVHCISKEAFLSDLYLLIHSCSASLAHTHSPCDVTNRIDLSVFCFFVVSFARCHRVWSSHWTN